MCMRTSIVTIIIATMVRDVLCVQTPLIVAVGGDAQSGVYSTDGKVWSAADSAAIDVTACCGTRSVSFSPLLGRFVAAVDNNPSNGLAYTDDGKTWIGLGNSTFSTGYNVIRVEQLGLFVAVGALSGTGYVATSADGISSYSATSTSPTTFVVISFNGIRFFASDDISGIYATSSASSFTFTLVASVYKCRTMCWFNTTHGFCSSDSGSGAYTQDGGTTWNQVLVSVGTTSVGGTCFIDGNDAYVSGANGITKSSDFFASWSSLFSIATNGVNALLHSQSLNLYLFGGESTLQLLQYSTGNISGPWQASNGSAPTLWIISMAEATNVIQSDTTISGSTTLTSGLLQIQGNFIVNDTTTVLSSSQVRVSGVTSILRNTFIFNDGASFQTGQLSLNSAASLQLILSASSAQVLNTTGSVTVVVFSYTSTPSGTFGSVNASWPIITGRATTTTTTTCSLTSTPQYGSSTMTVTVSLSQSCQQGTTSPGGGGLSAGAIAGIVVGAVCGGVLIALLVVLVYRHALKKREERFHTEILQRETGHAL